MHYRPGFRGAFIVDRIGYSPPFMSNKIRLRIETDSRSPDDAICSGNHQTVRMTNAVQQAARDQIDLQISHSTVGDHTSFLERGFPAMLITGADAANQPFARTSQDTIDKIDCDFGAQVTNLMLGSVARLSMCGGISCSSTGQYDSILLFFILIIFNSDFRSVSKSKFQNPNF